MRGNINSNKGITLLALILYIIVTIIVISMLSLVMTHFRNNLGNVDEKSVSEVEFDKLNLYLLKETRDEENFVVNIIDGKKLELFNGNTYIYNEAEKAVYLNNNIKIAQSIDSCEFIYKEDDNIRKGILTIRVSINGKEQTKEYILAKEIN